MKYAHRQDTIEKYLSIMNKIYDNPYRYHGDYFRKKYRVSSGMFKVGKDVGIFTAKRIGKSLRLAADLSVVQPFTMSDAETLLTLCQDKITASAGKGNYRKSPYHRKPKNNPGLLTRLINWIMKWK